MTAISKTVTATDGKTYNYVSCLLNSYQGSNFLQAYGYFEARMYLPGSAGKINNWPAFWANGNHSLCGTWPCAGEMDIMEGLGGGVASYHFHSPTTNAGGYPTGDYTGWHIFAAHWEPGLVKYYYDGVLVGSSTLGVTSAPMYLVLNNGISTQHGGPLSVPSTVLVDYVHVYSKDPNAVAVTPEANYGGPGHVPGAALDTTAPTAPAGLSGTAISTSQIDLKWNASSDNVGVTGYQIYRNGIKIPFNQNVLSYSDKSLSASTTYSYEVTAIDAAGNESARSNKISVTTQSVVVTPPPPPPPPSGSNLAVNAGFESGVNYWKYYGGAKVESVDPRSGAYSALVPKSAGFEQTISGLQPNTSYTLSAYLKVTASSSSIALGVKNHGGTQIAKSVTNSSYTLVTIVFKTGATNTSAKIFLYGNSGTGRADDVAVVKGP